MGQAKQRGSFEDRKAAAFEKYPGLKLLQQGDAPHYAFILDRSDVGRQMLDALRHGPAELKDRLDSPSFAMWDTTGFEFLILWGSWGFSGGLTIPAKDIHFLCQQGLPVVVQRTKEKGGLCAFALGISPEYHERVQAELAKLQPAEGTAS